MSFIHRFFVPSILLLIGLAVAFYPTFLSGFARMQGDLGDARFNNYILEHSFLWLTGNSLHSTLWDLPAFYPTKGVGAFSDLLLSVAPFYWIFRFVGLAPDTAFQCWTILMEVLNYSAMLVLLRIGFGFQLIPASFGAYFFAFANIRLVQFGHPQLIPQFYMLISIFSLLRIFESTHRSSTLWFAVLAFSFVCQLYGSVYHGWLFAFSIGILFFLAVLVPSWRPALRDSIVHNGKGIALACLITGVCVTPMALSYYSAAKQVGYHDYGGVHIFLPPIWGWLYLGDRNLLYSWLSELPTFSGIGLRDEKSLGWGLMGSICVLSGLLMWRRKKLRALIFLYLLICMLLLTNLSSLGSLWQYFYLYFPSAGAIRAPGRISLLLLIAASIGVTVFFNALLNKRSAALLLSIFGLLLISEQIQVPWTFDKQDSRDTYENIASELKKAGSCDTFVLTQYQGRAGFFKYHLDAMWAASLSGIPTINGYSGKSPNDWPFMQVNFKTPQQQRAFGRKLRAWLALHQIAPENVCWVFRNVWRPNEIFTRSVAKVLDKLPEESYQNPKL